MRIRHEHAPAWPANRELFLADLDRDPPPDAPREDVGRGADHVAEPDDARDRRKLPPIKVLLQSLPGLFPIRLWPHDRVDAEKRHPAQDKWCDGCRQYNAARQS